MVVTSLMKNSLDDKYKVFQRLKNKHSLAKMVKYIAHDRDCGGLNPIDFSLCVFIVINNKKIYYINLQ